MLENLPEKPVGISFFTDSSDSRIPKNALPHLNHFSEYSRLLKILGFISVVNSRAERTRTSVDYLVPNQVASPLADCPKKNRNNLHVLSLMVLFHESDHQPIEGTLFVFLMT